MLVAEISGWYHQAGDLTRNTPGQKATTLSPHETTVMPILYPPDSPPSSDRALQQDTPFSPGGVAFLAVPNSQPRKFPFIHTKKGKKNTISEKMCQPSLPSEPRDHDFSKTRHLLRKPRTTSSNLPYSRFPGGWFSSFCLSGLM